MAARPCSFHTRIAYRRYVLKIQLVCNRLTLPFKVNVKITTASKIKRTAKLFPIVPAGHKPGLDKTFLRQLLAILKIAFPSWRSKESLILLLHSFFLVARTVLSVGVARLDGRIVRDLVSADGKGFMKGLGLWFLMAIPSTYTNTMVFIKHYYIPKNKLQHYFCLDSSPSSQIVFAVAKSVESIYTRPVLVFCSRPPILSRWPRGRSCRCRSIYYLRYRSVLRCPIWNIVSRHAWLTHLNITIVTVRS